MTILLIASHNRGKLAELTKPLSPFDLACRSASDMNLAAPPETETTFLGNVRLKACVAQKDTGLATLADDSGCALEVLNGALGVLTADWCTASVFELTNGLRLRRLGPVMDEGKPAGCLAKSSHTLCGFTIASQ